MRAFFKYSWQPPVNPTTIAVMRNYLTAARNIIDKYRNSITKTTDPKKIENLNRDIAVQEGRIAQILEWFAKARLVP
jgi:hypothetical protein